MGNHHISQYLHAYLADTDTAVTTGDMFLRKVDEIFKDLPNVFGISYDNSSVGYNVDGKDHNNKVWRVLQICRQVNLKLNKDNFYFRCTSIPFFSEVISRHGVKLDPQKLKALTEMPPPKTKEGTPSIPWNN